MRDSLDSVFDDVIKLIVECKGKVIITGMGKPGHVASKMAATFSSLGTPSFYLHPAEAMHGDLGMVSKDDIVLAISYSGESDEIINILPGIKMIGAKLIGITKNSSSTLAKASDVVQLLPDFKEACNLGLAPTSSTTVELCYGDALAVVASEIYGFKDSDFGKFHPAGALGKKLIYKVSDLMATGDNVPKVYIDSLLTDAIEEMSQKRLSIVSIINSKNELLGIMTDADLRKVIKEKLNIYDIKVNSVMNSNPKVFYPEKLAFEALSYMKENKVNVIPIVSDKKLVGTLHWQQIIQVGIVYN